jgi:hypothetical protein
LERGQVTGSRSQPHSKHTARRSAEPLRDILEASPITSSATASCLWHVDLSAWRQEVTAISGDRRLYGSSAGLAP